MTIVSRLVRHKLVILASLVALMVIPTGFAYGFTTGAYGSGEYGACVYGQACSISITSNGSVSLNVTPTGSGSCTVQSDLVSVFTDDSNGYVLTLADGSNNTSLTNGTNTIASSSGTLGSPASLSGNGWGYRIDGLGAFGAGPTLAQSNASHSSTLFAGVTPSNSGGDTIASTSSPADPAVATTVWYGACANSSVGSGQYTTQVVYTAVAN
jgi:hypothetical protein